jgi:hypothetical protein
MSVSTLRSQRFALIQEKLGVTLHEAAGPAFSHTWNDPSELEEGACCNRKLAVSRMIESLAGISMFSRNSIYYLRANS